MALATFSYASWQASLHGEKTLDWLKRPEILIAFSLSALLFCSGLAATSDSVLEIAIWSILGFLFLVQIILLVRQNRESSAKNEQKNIESS